LAHVDAVDRELAAFSLALRSGPMDARVPTCPEWVGRDLADHVGTFCVFWTHLVCEGAGRPKEEFPPTPDDGLIPEWIDSLGAALTRELRSTDPAQPMWSWVPDQGDAAFAARRSAHELAIHRFDSQSMRGSPQPVDGDLAVDGVEEMLVMAEAIGQTDATTGRGNGESLSLSAIDQEAAWTLTLTPEGTLVQRSVEHADLHIEATASDLELLLLQRPQLGKATYSGDVTALDAWYRAFQFG
jgi:uncharacterized protein (TIGR03083 family)